MSFESYALLLAGGLFLAMLAMQEIGRRLGDRARRQAGDGASGTSVVDGAVFALLGLLIAFTFSGAASRFDERRKLIVEEANAIGTAYLRLDLLPQAARADLQESFRRYLDTRLAVYRAVPDLARVNAELARAAGMQQEIWTKSLAAAAGSPQPATVLLVPALNAMFDITTTRTMAGRMHPPMIIFALLCGLALLSAMLAGYAASGAKARNWVHTTVFALTLAGAVYVILDIEFPRVGFIRVDAFDQVLVDLRQSMR
jgi:hypothetical protein